MPVANTSFLEVQHLTDQQAIASMRLYLEGAAQAEFDVSI
jgi:hypothetical protein